MHYLIRFLNFPDIDFLHYLPDLILKLDSKSKVLLFQLLQVF